MEVKTCRNCGKLYNSIGRITPYCPFCMKDLEEKFDICRKFIKDNPGANIKAVAENAGVSVKIIKQWVREERLAFAEGSMVGIECESCGANILTGRFCAKCKQNLQAGLAKYLPQQKNDMHKPSGSTGGRMRFLDE